MFRAGLVGHAAKHTYSNVRCSMLVPVSRPLAAPHRHVWPPRDPPGSLLRGIGQANLDRGERRDGVSSDMRRALLLFYFKKSWSSSELEETLFNQLRRTPNGWFLGAEPLDRQD